ncbi:hypothetical protein PLUA15_160183 [Pseudomonas lundensis]|uniref:Uncharacterized protein n=1 Tax=Pseudomonas lundensis TaxID=86185 RepID=A0AAX2H340_9PSED|nr:hypothetical protein PLUA15_160183 [Pseudomonas lundensis]
MSFTSAEELKRMMPPCSVRAVDQLVGLMYSLVFIWDLLELFEVMFFVARLAVVSYDELREWPHRVPGCLLLVSLWLHEPEPLQGV